MAARDGRPTNSSIFHCVREEIIVGMSSQVSLIIGKGKAGIYINGKRISR
jgi:hypothetical protein